ncbi:type II toxin-antitoxin system YafQ family toxin, partial [Candidatus Venteria ishoeyi]
MPDEAKDHTLLGEYKDCREFHLGGDILLIYLMGNNEIT